MRERRRNNTMQTLMLGITPAYAGKTEQTPERGGKCRDHPRVCGTDFLCGLRYLEKPGSPPRMRERLMKIPMPSKPARDHPRVCGKDKL